MFDIIRDLKKRGIAVIYISHRMEEIFEICETATVMRDGRIIGTVNVGEVSPDRIVEMMVGREVSSAYPKRDTVPGEEILRVENLCRKDRRQNVSFSLRKGEVLGIAGLVGAGRTEIMRGLFGVDYITSCDVYVHGQKVRIPTPAAAKKHGIAFFDRRPQDRGSDARLHHQGQHEHGQPAEAAPGSAHEHEGGKRDRGPVHQAD